jgi:hydroxymethylpyrimidine pyrophosphatase-like HAD family hydrolase
MLVPMTPAPPRVVITDLDGTIVRADGTLSADTVDAASELQRLGIPLVVATARTPAGVAAVEQLEPLITVAVCCTGALGWLPETGDTRWTRFIGADAVGRIATLLARFDHLGLGSFDATRWRMTADYRGFRGRMPRGPSEFAPLGVIATSPACAMAVRVPGLTAWEIAAHLGDGGVSPDDATLTWAADDLLDIAPAGVNKATGVTLALELVGMGWEDAVAFGDMPNDLPMLRSAAVAVAVDHAHPDVTAVAGVNGGDVPGDGFAKTLRSLGILP